MKKKQIKEIINLPDTDYLYACHVLILPEVIDQDEIEIIAKEIIALRMSPINHPISVIINSVGGSEYAAFQIVELLLGLKQEVRTYALGEVCSTATDIFLAGDVRIATPRSFFMFHQSSTDESLSEKKYHELKSYKHLHDILHKIAKEYVTERAGKEAAKLYESKTDVWLTAKEAKKLGIVHRIEKNIRLPIFDVGRYKI